MGSASDKSCRLCGVRVPIGRRSSKPDRRFCCDGCERVADILASVPKERGERILAQARRLGIVPLAGASGPGLGMAAVEAPVAGIGGLAAERSERFLVDGYACPSCAWLLYAVLQQQAGVAEVEADFLSDSVRVRYDMRRTGPDELNSAVKGFGFGLSVLGEGRSPEELSFSRQLSRFLLALFLAGNAMMLSAVHWASYLEWIPPIDLRTVAFIQLVLVIPLIGLGVWPLLKRGLRLLRLGQASMDLLFVAGFTAAFSLSIAAFFTEASRFYFETCSAFVAISLFGRLVEGKLRLRAARELRGLLNLPATKVAVVLADGTKDFQLVESLEPGQSILVEPGQSVPLDAELSEPESSLVSEAMLTGEPAPVLKQLGDAVLAGSRVLEDALTLRVIRPYREGRLRQIADTVAQGLTRNELHLRSADRLAAWFVPSVLVVAIATYCGWVLFAGVGVLNPKAWMPAVSVVLVACPCAFGIASASALAVSVSALLGHGVLVKDGGALERIGHIDLLAVDKTGTLTNGLWQVEGVHWFSEPEPELLSAVAAAESGVEHPVAHALRTYLTDRPAHETPAAVEVELIPGRGVRCVVSGRKLAVGRSDLFDQDPGYLAVPARSTLVFFGWDSKPAGAFALGDSIRPGTEQVIDFFKTRGLAIRILSGDRQAVVDSIANSLGVQWARGDMLPEDKRAEIESQSRAGRRVMYCGDGTNDAPAMAQASVAVSLRHGTELSLSAAHLLPLAGDLGMLPPLVAVAERTQRTIWRNYAWAFGYNAIFLPMAAFGVLHPIFAAGLMFASSVTVLVNSLRLRPALDRVWQASELLRDTGEANDGFQD